MGKSIKSKRINKKDGKTRIDAGILVFLHSAHALFGKCIHLPRKAFFVVVGASCFIITPDAEQIKKKLVITANSTFAAALVCT